MPFHQGILGRFGGGVSTLFGGRADPNLSEEANRAASSDALVQAGLATILAEGPGGVSPSLIQALSQGALAGREAGGTARETALQQSQQAELQALADSGQVGPELMQDMFMQAVATGNIEAMRAISGVLPAMLSARRGSLTPNRIVEMVGTEGPGKYAVDMSGRELFKTGDLIPGTTSSSNLQQFEIYDEPDSLPDGSPNPKAGGKFFGAFDRSRGFVVPVRGVGIPKAVLDIEPLLGQAAFYALEEFERVSDGMATIRGQAIVRGGVLVSGFANAISTDEIQMAATSALNFINPIVRFLSGAQMTDKEAMRYYNALIDSFGDRAANKALKFRMRRNIIKATGFTGVDAEGNLLGESTPGAAAEFTDDDGVADARMRARLAQERARARRELIEEGVLDDNGQIVRITDASSRTNTNTDAMFDRVTGRRR